MSSSFYVAMAISHFSYSMEPEPMSTYSSFPFFILLSLSTQASEYTYDALNRLTHATFPNGQTLTYHYDAAGNLLEFTPETTSCLLYAVHDDGLNHSQLFTINPDKAFEIKLLGPIHPGLDLEALDIHPTTHQLFAASGDNGNPPGSLYHFNTQTGEPTLIGSTGFQEINGLSFHPDGTLWGWATDAGLIQVDPQTAQSTLIIPAAGTIEDLTWNLDGTLLYAVEKNQLWVYTLASQTLNIIDCTLPPGKIEALEMLPDGELLFAIHHDQSLSLHALDVNACILLGVNIPLLSTPIQLNDIEGLAWPTCE